MAMEQQRSISVSSTVLVVALVNAADVQIGGTCHLDEPVRYPPIPSSAPELFSEVRPVDISRSKRFRRGLTQIEQEGIVQVLHRAGGNPTSELAAAGQMQFEVFSDRLEVEFGAAVHQGGARTNPDRVVDVTDISCPTCCTDEHLTGEPNGVNLPGFRRGSRVPRVSRRGLAPPARRMLSR